MNKKNLVASIAGGLLLLLVAGIAVAAPGLDTAAEKVPSDVELPAVTQGQDEAEIEVEDEQVEATQNTNDNHGACVSAAAQDDTEFDEPWQKGVFVSSVAADTELTGADCDYSAHLEDAQNAEKPGNAPEDAGAPEGAGSEGSSGSSFGQEKANANRP